MARPQRKNVDYFPHYIGDGQKAFYIEQKYGNDGYACWFKLLETLAKKENHWINLNEKTELMFLASKCRVDEKKLVDVLNDLSDLGEIDKELWAVKVVWSSKFIDSIQDAYSKRLNKCQSLQGLRGHLLGLGILKGVGKPQSKVKKTKEEKSKEEKEVPPKSRIPKFEEFEKYALEKKPAVDKEALRLKYESWVESDWHTGGDKPRKIKNWKTTLSNTLPYMKESSKMSEWEKLNKGWR